MNKNLYILFITFSHYLAATQATELHHYLWANYHQFNKNYTFAQKLYDRLFSSHGSRYMYKGYIHLLFHTKQYESIAQLIPSLDNVFASDVEVQLMFSQALALLGNKHESEERIIKLNNIDKNNQEITLHTAQIYIQRKELENALLVIENYLNNSPHRINNVLFYFIQAQLYLQLNEKIKALASLHKSLELHPKFEKALLLLALVEEQTGNIENAINHYTHFIHLTPDTTQHLQHHLINLLYDKNIINTQNNLEYMNKNDFVHILNSIMHENYADALNHVNANSSSALQENIKQLLKINIFYRMNNYEESIRTIKNCILQDPENELWYSLLHTLCCGKLPFQLAYTMLQSLEKKLPNNIFLTLYLADIALRIEKKEAALSYIQKAHVLTKNPDLQTVLWFQEGLLLSEKGEFHKMKEALETGKAYNTNFTPLLNLLAYYYLKKERNVNKAEQLLAIILQQDPHNPHFLDTQAYIWYLQKKYIQARDLLYSLLSRRPHDMFILYHLSKTLHKLGDREKALYYLSELHTIVTKPHEKKRIERMQALWKKELS